MPRTGVRACSRSEALTSMTRQRFSAILVALMPLLSVYKSPIPGVDLATLTVLLTFIIIMLNEKRITLDPHSHNMDLVLLYVVLVTVFNLVFFKPSFGWDYAEKPLVALRLMKFTIIIIVYFTFSFLRNTDLPMLMFAVRVIVHINVLFIVIQQLLYLGWGIVVYNPFTNVAMVDQYQVDKYSMVAGYNLFRPSAFFLEPSHLAQYFFVYLCYVLYQEKNELVLGRELFITALGILCSGSGMGVLMLIALVAVWGVWRMQFNLVKTFFLSFLILIGFIVLMSTSFMQSVFSRVFTDNVEYGGNAIQARIGDGYKLYEDLGLVNKIFGAGFGNVPSFFLNGIAYMLNTVGVVGIVIMLLSILHIYVRAQLWAKWVLVVYVVMTAAAQMFSTDAIVYYIGVAYLTCENTEPRIHFLRRREVFIDAQPTKRR